MSGIKKNSAKADWEQFVKYIEGNIADWKAMERLESLRIGKKGDEGGWEGEKED